MLQDPRPSANALRIARVARIYPEVHAVDVVFTADGGVAAGVPVMLGSPASQQFGAGFLPEIDQPAGGTADPSLSGTRDLLCVVALADGFPIVIGWLHPQVGAVGFKGQANLEVRRHPSDYYSVTTNSADMAMHHPGGSFIAMGASVPKIAAKSDYDEQWELKRNVEIAATIRLHSTKPDGAAQGDVIASPGSINLIEFAGGHSASLDLQGGTGQMVASMQITIQAPVIKLN